MQTTISTARTQPSSRASGWLRESSFASFFRNRNNALGAAILLPILLLAVTAPILPIADPLKPNVADSLTGPSFSHFFGTDKLGRDIFSRTIAGLKVSLTIGFAAATLSMSMGILLGTMAGTMGRRVDTIISAFVDVLLAFPGLLLAIGIIAVFGGGTTQLIIALGISSMPAAIRLQRSLALGMRSRTFMDAARMGNAPTWWLLLRHVLPNTVAPMVVVATIYAANAILAEAALSFLGLGITPPEPSLGNLVADGRNYLREAWWISTIPGLAIVVVAISLHLFSDGIREQLDPSLRK
ncbi:MAG: ABC transporter permease [Dehalococcoidia bacterium]